MSFKRLETDDFVISTDAISSTLWSNNSPALATLFTSSTQAAGSSGQYYLNAYNTASTLQSAEVQFAIAYGNSNGSGSLVYNTAVDGLSPTSTIYGQWQDLVIGDENTNFTFLYRTGIPISLCSHFQHSDSTEHAMHVLPKPTNHSGV